MTMAKGYSKATGRVVWRPLVVLLMPLDLDPHSCPQGNYVPNRDELVEAQTPEYDVVLCLSLTKWVHLNWGDEGLKRMFRRIYRHLRPGGILVLEPQPWSSYGKRKTLTVSWGFSGHCRISFF